MKVEQMRWTTADGWRVISSSLGDADPVQLVLVFASPDCISHDDAFSFLKTRFPNAHIVGGSSAGNVLGVTSSDDDIVATAVSFASARVDVRILDIDAADVSERLTLAVRELVRDDLRHVLAFCDGLNVNGSKVADALTINASFPVTGGLMGDNGRFEKTYVIADGRPQTNRIVLVGLYGDALRIGYGCFAGWEEFGIDRVITKSSGNVVYEIDGKPALALYKSYLGDFADELPRSGLRFPLSIKNQDGTTVIRTLLSVDEDAQSLTFAGDVPEGATTLLMKGNVDQIISGAEVAAKDARIDTAAPGLAVVISCVGRRFLMDQLADEELDVVRETLGDHFALTGFYSYGELSPFNREHWRCQLHNQTMTLFTVVEP